YFLLDSLGFVDFLLLSFVLLAKARSIRMSFLEKITEIFWEFSRSVLYWLLRELIIQRSFMTLKKKYRKSKGLFVCNISSKNCQPSNTSGIDFPAQNHYFLSRL
ncbi:MAG: hypothetical protein ACXWRA_09300, partial [Pseudobdellovibrionaceae bacterium]